MNRINQYIINIIGIYNYKKKEKDKRNDDR